jgi:hypothetical protein
MLGHWEPFRQIQVVPKEIRTAQGVAAEVSELAILWAVAAIAGTRTRIHSRDKSIRIQPLKGALLRPPGIDLCS